MLTLPTFPSFLFTSAIPTKTTFTTEQSSITLTIKADDNALLTLTLYTYNGVATLYDLRSIIDAFLEDKALPTTRVTLTAKSGATTLSAYFRAIYASVNLSDDAQTFLDRHFLNTLSAIRLPRSASQTLSFIPTATCELTPYTDYVVQHADQSIEVIRYNRDTQRFLGSTLYTTTFCPQSDLLQLLDEDGAKILSFTHHVGYRAMTFYVTDDVPNVTLQVLNEFMCQEYIHLHAVTKQKLTLDRSTAQCHGVNTFYDDESDIEYEVHTAMLSYEEASHLSRVLLSPSLQISDESILLTDLTSELTDARNATNTIKFKYRYTTRQYPHTIATSVNTFTKEYTPEYD